MNGKHTNGPDASMPARHAAPIAVALDAPDLDTLRRWSTDVASTVACLKVGLEAFCRDGHRSVEVAREGAAAGGAADIGIFLDLKLHDIPATVAGACRSVAPLEPRYLTVHAAGGPAMVEAAALALPRTRITAVTVLTSLDAAIVADLGIEGTPADIVMRWAQLAVDAGARAIVCSPIEVAVLRAGLPSDVHLITPGVRPAGSDANDQKRSATPRQAIEAGADLLVIGRPITGQADPGAAARQIAAECRRP
ncbi:MAG: orotidine-5-phosphate decarboxylase [Actinomycetota bacterium]